MKPWACALGVLVCAVMPATAAAQSPSRTPRAMTLTLDEACPRPVARALRDDLAHPERTRVALRSEASPDAFRAEVRCRDGAVTLRVSTPRGTVADETLRGVAPHDLREALLGLLDRAEVLDEAPAPPAPPVLPAAPVLPVPSPLEPLAAARRWTVHAGPSVRISTLPGTVFWGVATGVTLALDARFGLELEAAVERGENAAPQVGGVAVTLFGVAFGGYVALLTSPLRWTLGLRARGGAASQQETGGRDRAYVAPWLGSAIATTASVAVSRGFEVRASAELGVAAAAAYATVDEQTVAGVGPLWFGASLAMGWSP